MNGTIKKKEIFVKAKIKNLIKLISQFKKKIKKIGNSPVVNLCIKILNKKFYNLGILNKTQCIRSTSIKEGHFLKRRLIDILKSTWKFVKHTELISLIKKNKVLLNHKPIKNQNLLLGLNSEKLLETIFN